MEYVSDYAQESVGTRIVFHCFFCFVLCVFILYYFFFILRTHFCGFAFTASCISSNSPTDPTLTSKKSRNACASQRKAFGLIATG